MKKLPLILSLSLCLTTLVLHFDGDSLNAQSAFKERIPTAGQPYGIAYDGENFWYSEVQTHKITRIPPSGRAQSYSLGSHKILGITYNPSDGRIYAGSEKSLIVINPVTGAVDSHIPMPVEEIAGCVITSSIWYLLEKGTGRVLFYDPALKRVSGRLETGHPEAKDIALYRGTLWISDISGTIHRYSLSSSSLTGTLQGPADSLRGLCFVEGQLWIVNRQGQSLQRLPYTETDFYITSGEIKYLMKVKISISIAPSSRGSLIVLLPPNTQSQKIRSFRSLEDGWNDRSFTVSGERVLARPAGEATSRALTARYECIVTMQNVRYLVPENFRPGQENLETSPSRFYTTASQIDFNGADPHGRLTRIIRRLRQSPSEYSPGLLDLFEKENIPARWSVLFDAAQSGKSNTVSTSIQAYLRNFGWVPVDSAAAEPFREFSSALNLIELYRMPDRGTRRISQVYLSSEANPSAPGSVYEPLASAMEITLERK